MTAKNREQAYIYRPYITLKNGRVLYARAYGIKAFRIPVNPDYAANDNKQPDLFDKKG